MSTVERLGGRLRVDGKFFREGSTKFHVKGVTYGPFAPNAEAGTFAGEAQTEQDFRQIKELGANVLRVYYVPPRWFLDLAHGHRLKVLVDIPWPKHLCFLDAQALRGQALEAVRDAATRCKDHPSLFAFSVVNEIPAEIVRWSGPRSIERFIDELVAAAKEIDPGCLCTFASFPPTEFLKPERIDFISFNVYLHEHKTLEGYLSRLQTLAGSKPLVLSELGMDSLREGEPRQAEHLASQIELVFRRGLAGAIVFSYTDDWFRGGSRIEDWAFGVTTQERRPKASFAAVQRAFAAAPYFPLRTYPKVSVVVASYNGASTLEPCLLSLRQLNYPNYELILVDDGSTDSTGSIAQRLPEVRTIRQSNCGLSAARNRGIAAAAGEIIAFTDADCRADEDWLYYLVSDLLEGDYMGVGGHNLLPHDDSWVAAAVMVSPGGPAHVMLTDTEAEHIPGCNMAFYKSALEQIGGFDPVFRKAGDDVDVCWRLQQQGYKIGFSPAGFVWHYRRSTVRAYLRQQNGYGEAEALLLRKHPQYFNSAGRSRWAGRIYGSAQIGILLERSIIYHGLFGSGAFQRLYTPSPSSLLMLVTSLEYHLVVTVPLLLLALMISWLWPVALTSLGLSLAVCIVAAAQAHIEHVNRSVYSRPLVALLFFLQPLERGLARYGSQLKLRPTQHPKAANTHQLPAAENELITYWSDGSTDRYTFLRAILDWMDLQKWQVRADTGWAEYDLEVLEARWGRLRLLTAAEYLEQGRVIVRCRLKTQWSLAANIAFWGLLGTEVVIAALLGPKQPWIWMVLLTIPVLGWVLEYQQARLRMMVAALIYEVAQQRKMVKIARTRQSDFREEASKSQNIGVAGELVNAPANR